MCQWAGWCGIEIEAQAAWAQAILSFVAIIAAGLFPIFHNAHQLARRVTSLYGFAQYVSDRAKGLVILLGYPDINISQWGDPVEWDQIRDAVLAVPIHDLPDEQLVGPFLELREVASRMSSSYRDLITHVRGGGKPTEAQTRKVREHAELMENIANQCRKVNQHHKPWNLWRKARAGLLGRD